MNLTTLRTRATSPVSGASLVVFRVLFGLAAVIGAVRFLARGWVESLYLAPRHHLTYSGFDWVQPLPAPFMYAHVVLLALLGFAIALGWHYRVAVLLYLVGFAYVELIDAALYLNHYWWATIATIVLLWLPADRMWSLDARSGRVMSSCAVPAWSVWTVRFVLGVVYFYAGIAKLQSDWLVHAQPMTMWLADRTDVPVVGALLDNSAAGHIASWAGAAFDCTIVFWLLWRRSRPLAYIAVVVFHVATAMLFQIGMFPWIMIVSTPIFFAYDWPLRAARRFGLKLRVPGRSAASTKLPVVFLGLLVASQIVLPLRHIAYSGDVRWTEEGYYGAWRVMLTEKAGSLSFRVTDPATGQTTRVEPSLVLTDWQTAQAAVRPDMMVTTARLIAADYAANGHPNVQVRADSFVSFNGRPNQRMIDADADLAKADRHPGHKDFVLPLRG